MKKQKTGSAIERIFQFIEVNEIKIGVFIKKTGLSNGYLYKMKLRKSSVGSHILEAIIKAYPQINAFWLLTGEGDMLKTKEGDILNENLNKLIDSISSLCGISIDIKEILEKIEKK